MNCDKYLELSVKEKWELIGKFIHLLQNDHSTCVIAMSIVKAAETNGKLDNVEILPNQNIISDP